MEIKPCGGAVFFRGACRDRYLGRRDCAGCEPLAAPAFDVEKVATTDPAVTEGVEMTTTGEQPAAAIERSAEPADADDEPTQPRQPRGTRKRP